MSTNVFELTRPQYRGFRTTVVVLTGLITLLGTLNAKRLVAQSLIADGAELQLISDDYKFTEGPAADSEGNVFFTDQPNDRIMKYSVSGKLETWLKPAGRSNGLFFKQDGTLIACADGKNELWAIAPNKQPTVLAKGFEGKLFNGPNDVWVAPDGALYFTDPFYKRDYWQRKSSQPELPRRVYRLSQDLETLTVAAEGFKQPNGIVGDPERGELYVADIGDKKTYRFKIGPQGDLIDRTLFCEQGSDGMTLDQDRNLYLTGKGVMIFDKSGKLKEKIEVPEGWTANVCFGGRKKDVLFITAMDSLYSIKMRTRGM
ncbi:MAG: SMP-30/gluconolactonase/LRE family protein [Aureliella sp.]